MPVPVVDYTDEVEAGLNRAQSMDQVPGHREILLRARARLLASVGVSGASGAITIIRLGDQPALDLALRGLDPSGPEETYVLWFVGARNRSLPVAFQAVGRDGEISGRTPIPNAAAGLLPSFDTAELTLTAKQDAAAASRRRDPRRGDDPDVPDRRRAVGNRHDRQRAPATGSDPQRTRRPHRALPAGSRRRRLHGTGVRP